MALTLDHSPSAFVREIKTAFSKNLHAQLRASRVSPAALAKLSGISRSVLSGYLSDDPALPNTVNLVRLALALRCEPTHLLPEMITRGEGISTAEVWQIASEKSLDRSLFEILDLSTLKQGSCIYYIPQTIPESMKTSTLRYYDKPTLQPDTTLSYEHAIRRMIDTQPYGIIILDEIVLHDLHHRRGRYQSLAPTDSDEQMSILLQFAYERFPQWQIKVIDMVEYHACQGILTDQVLLQQAFPCHFIIIKDLRVISRVEGNVKELVRRGIDLVTWYDAHSTHGAAQAV